MRTHARAESLSKRQEGPNAMATLYVVCIAMGWVPNLNQVLVGKPGGRNDDQRGKVILDSHGRPKCNRGFKLATSAAIWSHRLGVSGLILDFDLSESLWPAWQHKGSSYLFGEMQARTPTLPESVFHITSSHFQHCLSIVECTGLKEAGGVHNSTYWWGTTPCNWVPEYLAPYARHRNAPVSVAPRRAPQRTPGSGMRSVSPRTRNAARDHDTTVRQICNRITRTRRLRNQEGTLTLEATEKLLEGPSGPMRWDCYEILEQMPMLTTGDVEEVVDIMNDVAIGNRCQPLSKSVIEELQDKGHRIIVNGADGIPNEDMVILPALEPAEIWPEFKKGLMASIDKWPSQWNAQYALILAALIRGGIGDLRPADEDRDSTAWRAFLRTAFQSLVENRTRPGHTPSPIGLRAATCAKSSTWGWTRSNG